MIEKSAISTGAVENLFPLDATKVEPVSPDEAATLATLEIERLTSLLDRLDPADWEKPTYCTIWNVRQVVSHIVGALSVYADWERLLERSLPWTRGKVEEPDVTMPVFLADLAGVRAERRQQYKQAGFIPLDALNQFEVDQRATATPAELLVELNAVAQAAILNRRRLPEEIRSLLLPVAGAKAPVSYLIDVIYPRDIWMHRMEIALSTSHPIERAADHEGRLTALVMRDLARRLNPVLASRSVVYRLTGPDGGMFRFGPSDGPATVLTLDTVDFHLLASGRRTAEEARALTRITGDQDLGALALDNTVVVY